MSFINTLEETLRVNGTSWMENLTLAVLPWLPEFMEAMDDDHEDELSDAASIR